jgi:hypothetical protein
MMPVTSNENGAAPKPAAVDMSTEEILQAVGVILMQDTALVRSVTVVHSTIGEAPVLDVVPVSEPFATWIFSRGSRVWVGELWKGDRCLTEEHSLDECVHTPETLAESFIAIIANRHNAILAPSKVAALPVPESSVERELRRDLAGTSAELERMRLALEGARELLARLMVGDGDVLGSEFAKQRTAAIRSALSGTAPAPAPVNVQMLEALRGMVAMFEAVSECVPWGKTFLNADAIRQMNEAPIAARAAVAAAEAQVAEQPVPYAKPPKDKTEGLRNFVAMIVNDLREGRAGEAHLKAVDLWERHRRGVCLLLKP